MMKRFFISLTMLLGTLTMQAQGWPSQYEGVMLQGFYWDSYSQSQWVKLEKQADELSQYFSLVWLPQSANCGGTSMGYDDKYWFPGHYNSSFGTEAELRSLINTFKSKGISTIADVVINHRKNMSNWVDFPRETYQGVVYQLQSTDICANDDGGKTKTWATQNGYSLSENNDTGEGWDGMRDLDHKSENVQTNVKAYLSMLLNDLGYAGFRYDMVKGYAGSYTKLYNEASQPEFSVGEYWDGSNSAVKNWISSTGMTSAAFDFPFRYTVRDAINNNNWQKLSSISLAREANFKRYSVTFVENHDTEKRSNDDQDPIRKDTLAANAFLLAMPGTPCVFFRHWIDCKRDIKAMINVRRAAGIHNESAVKNISSQTAYYAVCTTGTKGQLLAVVGRGFNNYTPDSTFVKVLSGYHYAYYLSKSTETAWADLPSGEYEGAQNVLLTAVSNSDAQLVYTTDGTQPTAASTKVASGTQITIEGDVTLTVGLLVGTTVSGIVTRTYTAAEPVDRRTITVNVNTDKVGWTAVNFWTWGGDDSHAPSSKNWPGDKVTTTTTVAGMSWYSKQYTINGSADFVNFVFSTASGSPQTVDVNNISTDRYFQISEQKNGDGKHLVNDITSIVLTGIQSVDKGDKAAAWYTLDGRRLQSKPATRGLYVVNGRKVVVR